MHAIHLAGVHAPWHLSLDIYDFLQTTLLPVDILVYIDIYGFILIALSISYKYIYR